MFRHKACFGENLMLIWRLRTLLCVHLFTRTVNCKTGAVWCQQHSDTVYFVGCEDKSVLSISSDAFKLYIFCTWVTGSEHRPTSSE